MKFILVGAIVIIDFAVVAAGNAVLVVGVELLLLLWLLSVSMLSQHVAVDAIFVDGAYVISLLL